MPCLVRSLANVATTGGNLSGKLVLADPRLCGLDLFGIFKPRIIKSMNKISET